MTASLSGCRRSAAISAIVRPSRRGAAGHPEDVRVRERIPEQRLQQDAGQGEEAADAERGQEPRQPQVRDDPPRGIVGIAPHGVPRLLHAEPGAAEEQRGRGYGGRGGQQPGHTHPAVDRRHVEFT